MQHGFPRRGIVAGPQPLPQRLYGQAPIKNRSVTPTLHLVEQLFPPGRDVLFPGGLPTADSPPQYATPERGHELRHEDCLPKGFAVVSLSRKEWLII